MEDKENVVYYFQKKNSLFGDNVISICYKASDEEIKINRLTSRYALIFIKNKSFNNLDFSATNIDRKKIIKDAFAGQSIFLRVQSECMLGMYGDFHCDCEAQRQESIKIIKERDGVYIHLPQEALGYGIEYKFSELELQVSGRTQDGAFVGYKDKEEAQKYLMHHDEFQDLRKYNIVPNILKAIGLEKNKFVLITDSQRKLNEIECLGIKVEKYKDYMDSHVTDLNINEYLYKIIDTRFMFSEETWEEIFKVLQNKDVSESTFNLLLKLKRMVLEDPNSALPKDKKDKLFEIYESIVLGKERKYIYTDAGEATVRIKSKYTCKVNAKVFGALKKYFGKNIFDRIVAEELYFFQNRATNSILKIRNSEILDIRDKSSTYLKGQVYSQQTVYSPNNERIVENEVAGTRLRTYFENEAYDYRNKMQMITFISEHQVEGCEIYIKRLPKSENRVMDIYGNKEEINDLMDFLDKERVITNFVVADEDESSNNLVFSDYKEEKQEEVYTYNLLND
jgi:GTP cyclohydrolase II